MTYKQINNLSGWLVFAVATIVYIITSEPTVSFWDCGEYIATASGLQVGHPPGAPLFQILGRFFSLFSFGNELLVARMVNTMSALSSSFTILFLFWTITHLAKRIMKTNLDLFPNSTAAIIGSGIVGSLAYTFSDSFWFSAVEGEVYGMSSFFTALVFWAILKWENDLTEHGDKIALRWIILIAYLIGLSIGVHLLNLLTIPAIALVIYYNKYTPTIKGTIVTLIISITLLGFIMNLLIPGLVKLAGWFELFFINALKFPFNTGTVVYFLILGSFIVWGIVYTRRKQRTILNTIMLSLAFILIGYSSFFMIVIRSNANTPINENEPTNAISLLSYLNREQYGDWPLLYGPYYNAPVIGYKDGNPVYRKNSTKGKYEIVNQRKDYEPIYHSDFMTLFPRMWSSSESIHKHFYEQWGNIKGKPVTFTDNDGKAKTINKPSFGENLRYFFSYQLQYMYIRYFMWNFAGRQNDKQGYGDDLNGNWLTGINYIDNIRLGPQDNIPESMKSKARNNYYMLPLILGIIGLVFHVNRNPKDSLVVTMLFIMTGIAIVVYLNQYAPQPRERDYAYAASFYAFAIWIGIGVLKISSILTTTLHLRKGGIIATIICLTVPSLMAIENWDDHDRSGRYTARDIAINYLESCEKNAILFTLGDNDTFPLWYAQEVEGVRRDVRVVNLSLLNSDWYIGQMKRKVYDSDPLPISLTKEQFIDGINELFYLMPDERIPGAISVVELFEVIHKRPELLKVQGTFGELNVIPSNAFYLPIDSLAVVKTNTVISSEMDSIVKNMHWEIPEKGIIKNNLILLDIIAHNNWKRPIYFSSTAGTGSYIGLGQFLRNEGFALRLVPISNESDNNSEGYVNTDILYDRLMKRYSYGNMNDSSIYLDETNIRMINNLRTIFARLAKQLVKENKYKEAVEVCDKCLHITPNSSIPYNFYMLDIAESYIKAGEREKGVMLLTKIQDLYTAELNYYFRFPWYRLPGLEQNLRQGLMVLNGIASIADENNLSDLKIKATSELEKQFKRYEKAGF